MKKRNLYIYGCSYSAEFINAGINDAYYEYKGYHPKSWSELLSKKLDLNLINRAFSALGNDYIFDTFCSDSAYLTKNDIVIVGWSYMNRFRLANNIDLTNWELLSSGCESTVISKSSIDQLSVNRTHPLYETELLNRESFMKSYAKCKEFNIFFWNAGFPFKIHNEYLIDQYKINPNESFIEVVMRHGGYNIETETNGNIKDNHLGEEGHKIQAELFYKELINKI